MITLSEESLRSVERTPIWHRSPEEVNKWSSTLSRVVALSSKRIIKNWDPIRAELLSAKTPEETSQAFKKAENFIIQLPKEVETIYHRDLLDSSLSIAARVNRLSKDIFSARLLSIRESFRGNDGVLLVSHTRSALDSKPQWIEQSVIKWTTPIEAASCEIFKLVLDDIYIQESSILDFDHGFYLTKDACLALEEPCKSSIQQSLTSIRRQYTEKEEVSSSIMIAERLPGSNLADFITDGWEHLTPRQKEDVFTGIGKLALADLIMGNIDRFIMFDMEFAGFDLEFFTANIGNLMIHKPSSEEKGPELYAIDNGIQVDNIEHGREYVGYNNALSTLLQAADWQKTLATAIITALSKAAQPDSYYFETALAELHVQNNVAEIDEINRTLGLFTEDLGRPGTKEIIIQSLLNAKDSFKIKFQEETFLASLNGIREKYNAVEATTSPSQLCNAVATRINLFLTN